jgi:hypothetical protein
MRSALARLALHMALVAGVHEIALGCVSMRSSDATLRQPSGTCVGYLSRRFGEKVESRKMHPHTI